jgi:Fe-S-cluster containining protein
MTPLTDTLCLQCGLCCNGVLFADVRPERGNRSPLFAGRSRVSQPCPAFDSGDCTCGIYADRPARCRKFECKQLLGVSAGKISTSAALKKIRAARKLAAKAELLLTKLGFNDEKLPLRRRFARCQRAAEQGALPREQFGTLADLQLAMHKLTLSLAANFYEA